MTPPSVLYFALVVLAAFLSNPTSFTFAWNEGRSGLLFIIPLAVIEMGRDATKPLSNARYPKFAYLVVGVSVVYYIVASIPSFTRSLVDWAVMLGVDPLIARYSWIATVDYTAASIFVILLTYLVDEPRPVTPGLYLVGMTSFLFVDTVLPYNSLGPFQAFVPPMLVIVAFLVNATGYGHAAVQGNILSLHNSSASLNLAVFWPSAGLHGIIISVLAIAAVAVKLRTGWRKGVAYTVLGVIGSMAVNLMRIVLLALYALSGGADPEAFERFHSVVGELLFLPWIAAFLYLMIRRETIHGSGGKLAS